MVAALPSSVSSMLLLVNAAGSDKITPPNQMSQHNRVHPARWLC